MTRPDEIRPCARCGIPRVARPGSPLCFDCHHSAPRGQPAMQSDETPACAGKPEAYDVLTDYISGPRFDVALEKAKSMCATCDLFAKCLPAHRDEQWAKAIMGQNLHRPTKRREVCGTIEGFRLHSGNNERPCDKCEAVRPKPRVRPEAVCGTDGGYYRHRRKLREPACEACRVAHNEAQYGRNRKLRGAAA